MVRDSRLVMGAKVRDGASEEDLIRQAVRGDAKAFGALYGLYHDAIYTYIYYRTGRTTTAEDLTENVFLKAWRAMGSYARGGLRFSSWLYRIAQNVVIDHYRTRKHHLPLGSEAAALAQEQDAGPEELMLMSEEVKELQYAISLLSVDEQQVIVLRFVEGLSHAQVAEIVGKTKEACRVIQHRALAELSRLLNELE